VADEDIVRLVLDGTVIKARLDRPVHPHLEAALVALSGDDLPIQRCPVHKHRNVLAHAPRHMHDEPTADDRDLTCACAAAGVERRRNVPVQAAPQVPGDGRQS
jgi:hypothetical protein